MRCLLDTIVKSALVLAALACLPPALHAEEAALSRSARSISYVATDGQEQAARATELDKVQADILPALVTQGFRAESAPSAVYVENVSYHYGGDIIVYDAVTTLISDFDGDGFYHRFSVAIDADTIYSTSWVYAELYLSYEGGPWNYYATSADFHIHGDSELDMHVVETELAEGFPAGYYDILIELYDAETGDLLHSYGPYDDDSLSALPLEDSVYDEVYYSTAVTTEVIVSGHGGLGGVFIAAFALVGFIGRISGRRRSIRV